MRHPRFVRTLLLFALLVAVGSTAWAYIEIPYTLGRIVQEAVQIAVLRVDKVDKEKNIIIYSKVQDLKGKTGDVVKHNIARGGFHEREWKTIMENAEPGSLAVFFYNGNASETCQNNYWYQAYGNGEWWNMSHGEPYLLRSFAGRPEKLITAVNAILGNQEVVIPCMVDGDKMALQLRTAKIQRIKASLKIQDYDAKRDFIGWGGEDFRRLEGMPAFSHYAGISRADPEAGGVAPADVDGDGKLDLCLYGAGRTVVLHNAGTALNEIALPYSGPARSADWADYNGDERPDLLLATPTGPKLLTNLGETKFADDSAALPREPYYNLRAAAWIDHDGDGQPDILLANGHFGLRLYKHKGKLPAVADSTPKFGKWSLIGPFDNTQGQGFQTVYGPEETADPAVQHTGRGGEKVAWREMAFEDGKVHPLAVFKPEFNNNSVVYLRREIDVAGAVDVPASFGSDDALVVWLNGEKIVSEPIDRAAAPDQNRAVLKLRPGKNVLLLKVVQGSGDWGYYFSAGAIERVVPLQFTDVSDAAGLGPQGLGANVKGDRLLVADLNGDRRPDFLYTAGPGVVAFNTPTGFTAPKKPALQLPESRGQPLLADLDGDKDLDLLIPAADGCRLFRNDGQGQFTDATATAGALRQLTGQPTSLALADLEGTGKPNLIVGCLHGPNRYLKAGEKGQYVDATHTVGLHQKIFNTRGLAALDLNKDGVTDLVFNNEGQESAVLLGAPREQVAAADGAGGK